MAKKLNAEKAKVAIWKENCNEASDKRWRRNEDRVSWENRRLELLEEANLRIAALKAIPGDEAMMVRLGFELLVENVRSMDCAPCDVIAICREVAA